MYHTRTNTKATLEKISEEHSGKRSTDASGLLKSVDLSFILSLVLYTEVLHITKLLSNMLQSPTLDLAAAADMVETVREDLAARRNEEKWAALYQKAKQLAQELDITPEITETAQKRKKKTSTRLAGSVVLERTGQKNQSIGENQLRGSMYYTVLDHISNKLNSRFSEQSRQLLRCIAALDPCNPTFLQIGMLEPMAEQWKTWT